MKRTSPRRGYGILDGAASIFGSFPLSIFPPRKSAWEQSGDDIRAAWQDVGDSLRWAMDEHERENEIEIEIDRDSELKAEQTLQVLQGLEIEIRRMKMEIENKRKVLVVRGSEDSTCA